MPSRDAEDGSSSHVRGKNVYAGFATSVQSPASKCPRTNSCQQFFKKASDKILTCFNLGYIAPINQGFARLCAGPVTRLCQFERLQRALSNGFFRVISGRKPGVRSPRRRRGLRHPDGPSRSCGRGLVGHHSGGEGRLPAKALAQGGVICQDGGRADGLAESA